MRNYHTHKRFFKFVKATYCIIRFRKRQITYTSVFFYNTIITLLMMQYYYVGIGKITQD